MSNFNEKNILLAERIYNVASKMIVADEYSNIIKATEKMLLDKLYNKLQTTILVLENGAEKQQKEKQRQLNNVDADIVEKKDDIKQWNEILRDTLNKKSENERELNSLSYELTPKEEILFNDAKKHLKKIETAYNKHREFVRFIENSVKKFKKFRKDFKEEHNLNTTLGKMKRQFINEWQSELNLSHLKFLSNVPQIKKKQMAQLEKLKTLVSDKKVNFLIQSAESTLKAIKRNYNEIKGAVKKFERQKQKDKKTRRQEERLSNEISEQNELIDELKEDLIEYKKELLQLQKEKEKIIKIPVYKDNELEVLNDIKKELGNKKNGTGIYKSGKIYTVIVNTINEISSAVGLFDVSKRADMAKKIEQHFTDWDMSDIDFRIWAKNPGGAGKSFLSLVKKHTINYAMKERNNILKNQKKRNDVDEINDRGTTPIDSLTYNDGWQGEKEKIKAPHKADTEFDALYWKDVMNVLNKDDVKNQIIKNSIKTFNKELSDSKSNGGKIAPYHFFSGWLPNLKVETVDKKQNGEKKTKYRTDIGGRKLTDSELRKIWYDLFDKLYKFIDKHLWKSKFRDSRIIGVISQFMGDPQKKTRTRRVAGIVWGNILLKIVEVLKDRLYTERKQLDDEEIGGMFGVHTRGGGNKDVDAELIEIEQKLRLLTKVEKEARLYAEGKLLKASIIANKSVNITREFIPPKEMIMILRKNYKRMKQADFNDTLSKRTDHLFNETTEEEAPIGEYSNQVSYGPRLNTVERRYGHIVFNIIASKI